VGKGKRNRNRRVGRGQPPRRQPGPSAWRFAEDVLAMRDAAAGVGQPGPPPEPPPGESSTERLVQALEQATDPNLAEMIAKARAGYYHEYKSPLPMPLLQLVADLRAAGHEDLAQRVINGDFDTTKAEADAWAESAEGRGAFQELMGGQGAGGGRRDPRPSEPDDSSFWVESDVAADGQYVATARYGNHIRPLGRTDALEFAEAMLAHYSRADYDAAVLNQLTVKLRLPEDAAVEVVQGLRKDRPPIEDKLTAPITVRGGVAKDDGPQLPYRPFLTLAGPDGKVTGQIDVDDAAQIIRHLLEGPVGTDLDNAYFRHLVAVVGIDEHDRARAVINDLQHWRHPRG
jgi:hypothetical protein